MRRVKLKRGRISSSRKNEKKYNDDGGKTKKGRSNIYRKNGREDEEEGGVEENKGNWQNCMSMLVIDGVCRSSWAFFIGDDSSFSILMAATMTA